MATADKLVNLDGLKAVYDKVDGDISALKSAVNQITDEYAKQDGYYQEMTVGDAEQLVSSQYVEDSVPYTFRTSGGTQDIGNREYLDKVVGGTVCWNQLIRDVEYTATNDGVTLTSDSGGLITLSGTSTKESGYINFSITGKGVTILDGHAYLINVVPKVDTGTTNMSTVVLLYGNNGGLFCYNKNGTVVKWSGVPTAGCTFYVRPSYTFDGTFAFYCSVIDLTSMFGSTIADYLYSLEQSTPGAGVAWFRALFPADYYPYDAGTLRSVEGVSSHDMVGFNQWDEEFEIADINWTTRKFNPNPNGGRFAAKNYIPVIPGCTYYFKLDRSNAYCAGYIDSNGNGGKEIVINAATNTAVIPDDVHFIKFGILTSSYGKTYKHDICINLSWSGYRNGEYEPYEKHSYPLDSTLTLRGIPKLDSANKLYWDGDEYAADGTVTRRYGVVDLGTLEWSAGTNNIQYYCTLSDALSMNGTSAICPEFINHGRLLNGWSSLQSGEYSIYNKTLRIYPSTTYTQTAAFKAAMSGVMLVYELATPTTETADPYTPVQYVDDFGTEEFVTTGIVPVGHSTRYPANLRDKLQHLPDLASGDGYYLIQQANNSMSLVNFRIPQAPTTDGTYTLKATVSGGTPTYTWVDDNGEESGT